MRLPALFSLAVLVTMAGRPTRVEGQQAYLPATVDAEEFREALLNYVTAVQHAIGESSRGRVDDLRMRKSHAEKSLEKVREPAPRLERDDPQDELLQQALEEARSGPLVDQILDLSHDQLYLWMSYLRDPDGHVERLNRAAETVSSGLAALAKGIEADGVARQVEVDGAAPQGGGAGHIGDWFVAEPDYPPNDGDYKIGILDELAGFGLLPNPPEPDQSRRRCDTAEWGEAFKLWNEARVAAFALEDGYIAGSCDPTGIACGVSALPFVVAKAVMDVASIPIVLCDAHIANVDSAEIEATLKNTRTIIDQGNTMNHNLVVDHDNILGRFDDIDELVTQGFDATQAQLDEQDAALATHDTDIKNVLSAHDGDIKDAVFLHDLEVKATVLLHDTQIKANLATHDADIKALLAALQAGVDANSAKLDVLLERQLEVIRLLHTPEGLRTTDIPACDGKPCTWQGDARVPR